MNTLKSKLTTLLLIALFGIQSYSQSTYYENFDAYKAGEKFIEQSVVIGDTNWLLWSGDTAEDGRISADFSLSKNNALLIEKGDDIIFTPGTYNSGRWFFSAHIYVVSGYDAYFNMMHSWNEDGSGNQWACQVFFSNNGTGSLNVGGENISFNYLPDTWLYFSMEMNIDKDTAIFWINDDKIHEWPWHYTPNGQNGSVNFEAVDFYGWNNSKFYLDELTVSTDAIIRFEDATTSWDGTEKSVTVKTYPPNIAYDVRYNGDTTAPTEPGVYAIEATITEQGYSGRATGTLTINKTEATISMVNEIVVYDGTPQEIAISTNPADLQLAITYNGSTDLPVSAGTYIVEATVNDTYYCGTASAELTIEKAVASISFTDTVLGYNGDIQEISLETNPVGLATSVTYNGGTDLPIERGLYTVEATIVDRNYEGTATTSFEIVKGSAQIILSNLETTYDSSAKAVKFETIPAGLVAEITYNGSTDAPNNAGTYEVIGTITDANYSGNITGVLSIQKAVAEIFITNPTHIFDGTLKGVEIETQPTALPYSVTYNGATEQPTDAGEYETTVTITEANYEGEAVVTMRIEKAAAEIFISDLIQTYNGDAHSATVETTPAGLSTSITYNGLSELPIDAGIYSVVVELSESNYSGTETVELEIRRAVAGINILNTTVTYDGTKKQAEIVTEPMGLTYQAVYNGISELPIDAGDYLVEVRIADKNYQGEAEANFEIRKKEANITLTCENQDYNGEQIPAIFEITPNGIDYSITYNGQSNIPVNAGDYDVEIIITDFNYTGTETCSYSILRTEAVIELSNLNWEYSGEEAEATVKTNPENLDFNIRYNHTEAKPVDAGEYTVVATINSMNFTGSTNGVLLISAAAQYIEWNQEFDSLAEEDTIDLNASTTSELAIEYLVEDESIAKIEDGKLIILSSGETTITASQPGNNNYRTASMVKHIKVLTNSIDNPLASELKHHCYPNPVIDWLIVEANFEHLTEVKIYNQAGRLVRHEMIEGINPRVSFSDLPAGLYIVNFANQQNKKSVKITKR